MVLRCTETEVKSVFPRSIKLIKGFPVSYTNFMFKSFVRVPLSVEQFTSWENLAPPSDMLSLLSSLIGSLVGNDYLSLTTFILGLQQNLLSNIWWFVVAVLSFKFFFNSLQLTSSETEIVHIDKMPTSLCNRHSGILYFSKTLFSLTLFLADTFVKRRKAILDCYPEKM